jgi:hypothetical protein
MIISTDNVKLKQYFDQADRKDRGYLDEDGYDDEDDEEDSDEEDERPKLASKRKAAAPQRDRGRPKKAKAEKLQPLTYQLRSRCRETEGQIYYRPDDGTIKFKDKNLASFVGKASLPGCGNLSFTALKVSDDPGSMSRSWYDYTERQYEMERVSRW